VRRALLLALLFTFYTIPVLGASIQVTWNPNTESDLAGYKVYYGTASGVYGEPITVVNPAYTLTTVQDKTTYYFAISAFDTSGNESEKSNEISIYVPDVTPPAKPTGLMQRLVAWLKSIFHIA
jgi:fibronectin type 3 domain-containing protein